jgi:glutamyl/glutaminyl-tRNA synthetase
MLSLVYRGRLAPTPTGQLHTGHGRTFWIAAQRARQQQGELLLRIEDLDQSRCKPEYTATMLADLSWLGINWSGEPVVQSQRLDWYHSVWKLLHATGLIYPSPHSRADVQRALQAPHAEDDLEPLFPVSLRPTLGTGDNEHEPGPQNWRFRVPDGQAITFQDGRYGQVSKIAGQDFGDFLVWRKDCFPSYELAVVADDHDMQVNEVVRGEDLLLSTARQILLYQALHWSIPAWYHCPLVLDEHGRRLAKRDHARTLADLRANGVSADALIEQWAHELQIG